MPVHVAVVGHNPYHRDSYNMQFYPHNLPITKIGFAVSASFTELTTYLNNFQNLSVTVNTASVAINITGSNGSAGSSYVKGGERGPTGATGPQGYRGDSLYILSSSWNAGACSPAPCYAIDFGYSEFDGVYYSCNFANTTTLYASTATVTSGDTMYLNFSCTTLATNLTNLAYQNSAYSTNGSGVLSSALGVCLAV